MTGTIPILNVKLRKAAAQFAQLPRALKLVWDARPGVDRCLGRFYCSCRVFFRLRPSISFVTWLTTWWLPSAREVIFALSAPPLSLLA